MRRFLATAVFAVIIVAALTPSGWAQAPAPKVTTGFTPVAVPPVKSPVHVNVRVSPSVSAESEPSSVTVA